MYRHIITFRVGDQMRAELESLVASRGTDLGKLMRSLVRRALSAGPDAEREEREQILFLAIAMDGLLGAHADHDLRDTVVRLWRARLAEEEQRHGA